MDLEKIRQYYEIGQKWQRGEVKVTEFQGIKLNDKQQEFINSKDRFTLANGGFASGKTTAFIIKLVLLALWYPDNRILLGRKTRQSVEQALLPDFFDICPAGLYEHKVGPGIIRFFNGTEILIMGLDALQSGAGQDIKKAEQSIKSLNLGAVFIDQLEEIEMRVFEALDGRMRRGVGFNQFNATTNPANFWAYDYFKAHPRPRTKLVDEMSMLDNKDNLPIDFIESQLERPKSYRDRYVFGKWSPDYFVEGTVFAGEYIQDQALFTRKPLREFDGIEIFEEPKQEEYQIGVDPSEGSTDPCAIKVISKTTGKEVASFNAFIPISAIADKVILLASMYSLKEKPLVVPEATGVGLALVEDLKKKYDKIYIRESWNERENRETNKLGFHTNFGSKTRLIENMRSLFQARFAKISDIRTLEELKTFIYSDEARNQGAGAQRGYHDDNIMALMLAYWKVIPRKGRTDLFKTKRTLTKKNTFQFQ